MRKLILLLLLSNACLAQGFIEVEVRDTLVMKPVGFVYEISISDRYNYEEMVDSTSYNPEIDQAKANNDKKNDETRKLNELESFLKKNKYRFEQAKNYDTGNPFIYGRTNKSFLVTLKTTEALDKLTKEVEQRETWSGSIADIDYGDPTKIEAQLMEKLIKRAKAKAIMIAGLTDQKLGPIIEFREQKASDELNYTVTDLILNSKKRSTRDFFKQGLNGELSKTVAVKFKTL